ncbi:uncharacterized protein LOC119611531 isoform X2 [Lucilia sericata]|uniref:uncharacterized protein LOC119611531 isoform X2 n=1 Tax=Lucilia sericata TaxID=13632 RepID=UPI0018A81747|nr:uncharacterized protein LOC119611531 isoform X2 [Lucilia sericata]
MFKTNKIQTLLGLLALYLCLSIDLTQAQENAQLQIPPSLVECYNTSYYMDRANRLPSNIETLITLIEKVENSYGFNQDIRQLAVSLTHRFRQDGIQRANGVAAGLPGVIPYSPTGFQFPKFRILLQRLIPGNAFNFPNNSLTSEERCSLHFMLSSSFDTRVRGDENTVCSNLAQYRSQRLPRALHNPQQRPSNFIGDVEILDSLQSQAAKRGAPMQAGQRFNTNAKSYDYEYGWNDYGYNNNGGSNSISQCPVENGVIRTQWGTVAAGTLLAGIAAGLQPQTVPLRTLLAMASRRNGYQNMPQIATVNVDNRWAATVAGDLAEVALVQVPVSANEQATVGAIGAWNSTVMPKWYFLSQRQNLEMTDAEIRGGIDGLILALNIAQWNNQINNLKLSQVLRMYYSLDGVLGSGIMACNRMATFQGITNYQQTMMAQTSAFAQVLDREMQLVVTLSPDSIANFSLSATNALINYLPVVTSNPSTDPAWNQQPQHITNLTTVMTDIFVFLDTYWEYDYIVDYLNYVVQRLNINPYGSSITLLAARDGSTIVERTFYITDYYEKWNKTSQSRFRPGFSLPLILSKTQLLAETILKYERNNSSLGGRSMIALLIPSPTAFIYDYDFDYCKNFVNYFNNSLPDLTFLYYAGGAVIRFNEFVDNKQEDIFVLSYDLEVKTAAEPLVKRIRKVPRRLTNPRCSAYWTSLSMGSNQIEQYEPLGHINFYRLSPHYFFSEGSMRYLKVKPLSAVAFIVCTSRSNPWPYRNPTEPYTKCVDCKQITTMDFSFDLGDLCLDYDSLGDCPPLYLSVQAQTFADANQVACKNPACATPDETQYAIMVNNLDCTNSAASTMLIRMLNLVLILVVTRTF